MTVGCQQCFCDDAFCGRTDLKEVAKPCELEPQDPEQQNLEQQGPEPQHPEPQDPQPQELEPQDLETTCSKCHSNFVMPKILPCGHLFCKDCIVSVIDSQMQPCCPRCKNPFFSPAEKDKSSPVILADSLPTDFVMEELARSADVLAHEPLCCVCDDVRAESICLQCRDMLCAACTKAHKKLSMSSSHEVVSLSTVPVKSLAATHPLMCRVHTEKQADFFCSDHRLAVCGLCSVKKHRECSQVRELGEEVESADNALNGMTQVLAQVEERLQNAIGQLNERLHEVDVSEEEDRKSVDDACEYLLTLVKDFQKKLNDKSHDSHEKVRKSLSDVKNGLVKRSEEVTSHKSIVKRAREVAALPAKIEVSKTLRERINGLDLKVTLDRDVGKDPVTTAKFCEEVVTKVKKELTEEDDPPRVSSLFSSLIIIITTIKILLSLI